MVELKETEIASQTENDKPQLLQENSGITKSDQKTEQIQATMSEDNPEADISVPIESASNSSTKHNVPSESTNDDNQKSAVSPESSNGYYILSLSTKLIICRSIFYVVILFVLFQSNLSSFVQIIGSLGLVCVAIASSCFLVYLNNVSVILKKYIVVANAVIDLGVIIMLFFINLGTSSFLMLGFPLITFLYGALSNTAQLIVISVLSVFFNWLSCLAFGDSVATQCNLNIGILVHGAVFCWVIVIHKIIMRVNQNLYIKCCLFSWFTTLLNNIPKPVSKKIMQILQFQKIDSLEYEFRKKYELLIHIINDKTMEIEKLKVRLENEGYSDNNEEDFSNAVLELNNLMEIENLTLREENEKLEQLVKGLEERVAFLTQEIETLSSELERTYQSSDLQNEQNESLGVAEDIVDATTS